ncbi:MAG: BMP family ABC transporter substrate-binding protein [Anaerolineae bacterium]
MFKSKRLWVLLALVTIVALLVTACRPAATPTPVPSTPTPVPSTPTPPPPPEKLKVAFVYVAPIGDLGWTWAHEQGRLMVERELGDRVETAYIENVPEGPDAERVIRDYAQKGYDVIFTTSFGFMDPTITVASEFPDKYFMHCSGYKTADNSATYFGKIEEPRYVSGLVAGKMTKVNKIGYVAAYPIPEVIRGINAFTLGVRTANSEATVRVVWTQTWFDPVKEKEAAVALLDEGCDVIAQHQDTTEPQKAAQERGAVSIGYDSDMSKFVGDTVLASPVWNWGIYYVEQVKAVLDGTWKTHQYWGGWQDGIVDLAPLSPMVPDDVKKMADAEIAKFKKGEATIFTVFAGPIKGQNGELSIPAGVSMTAEELLSMDWFVEGVVGESPGKPPVVEEAEKPKVAFVYVGPTGDLGWTYAHDQGRLYLEKELGVETAYSELVAEGPDSTRIIRDYAEKGYDVIFATSFGYMDSVIEVAAEYPDIIFEHCTGYETADNVGIYDGRGYQGWYLAGIAAGKVTKNNKLGYVAPYPIPEVVRNMNAFTLGARSVNPKVEVHSVWIFTWVDPVKEREAAQALLDLGCDVIARESDSTEPDKLAEENGVYAVGYNAYVPDVAPNALLTAPIWNWGIFYKKAVQAVMSGTWTNTPVWWGLAQGLLDLAPFGPAVPDDAKALIEEKKQAIIAGTFDVFHGPIKDNTGEVRVPEGVTMPDEEKLAFDWLVEGVVGTIPE